MPRSQVPLTALLLFFTALGVLGGAAAATALTSAYGSYASGDINCSGGVDSVDALQILRHVAGLQVNLPTDCPGIGSTPESTPTPAPTAPATVTPAPSPTPSPPPSGPIAHCWMAVMGFAFVNPGVLGGSADCSPEPQDSPAYTCTIYTNIGAVTCDSPTDWPYYGCDYYELINDALCFTSSSYYPDYDCGVYDSIKKVNCYVESLVSPVDGPDYRCTLAPTSVTCTTDNAFYADFVCDRSGSHFTCH